MYEVIETGDGDVDFFLFVSDTDTGKDFKLNDMDTGDEIFEVVASGFFDDTFAFSFDDGGVPFWDELKKRLKSG